MDTVFLNLLMPGFYPQVIDDESCKGMNYLSQQRIDIVS